MKMDPNYLALYEEACRYDRVGDVYTAVKLFKKVIRLAPDWPDAYRALAQIYTRRREWKPAFHYWSKTLGQDSPDREAWWQLGLAAVALGKRKTARNVWQKFGFGDRKNNAPIGLYIKKEKGYEVVWMQALDPGRGRILSIPNPDSGLRYRDLMLYDRRNRHGYQLNGRRRMPIYEMVDRIKASPFQTYSCKLHVESEADIDKVEQLCFDAGLGFEVWSNAQRSMNVQQKDETEMTAREKEQLYLDMGTTEDFRYPVTVAIAAIHPQEVDRVLNAWQLVTLASYSELERHATS